MFKMPWPRNTLSRASKFVGMLDIHHTEPFGVAWLDTTVLTLQITVFY